MTKGLLHVYVFHTCNNPFLYDPRQIHGIHIVEILFDQPDEVMDVFGDIVIFVIG